MEGPEWIRPSGGRLLLDVKVVPGASRTLIAGVRDGALLVRVAAPPEKGRANAELLGCLASSLGLPKSSIELVSGALSRRKRVSLPLGSEDALLRAAGLGDGTP